MAGINTASAADKSLYDDYLRDFKSNYPKLDSPEELNGTENFYDAALFTLLAASAAGNPAKFTGRNIATGMSRLVDAVDGTAADLTLDDVKDFALNLNTSDLASYALTGTLGPPNFDVNFGTRKALGQRLVRRERPGHRLRRASLRRREREPDRRVSVLRAAGAMSRLRLGPMLLPLLLGACGEATDEPIALVGADLRR